MTSPDSGCPATGAKVGAAVVGFGGTTCADGADAEGLGDAVRLGTLVVGALVVGALVVGAGDETGAGDGTEAGDATVAGEPAAANDPIAPAAVDVAASGLAGVGFTLACLVDVEHAAAAAAAATAAIASRVGAR
jgi:hypothetical protein